MLYVEPFDGGSHAAFTRALLAHDGADWTALTLPGRHWKWRMRGAAAWFAATEREALEREHDVLLCSSYLSLGDLVALVPSLAAMPKAVYFHENQWAYPVREERERDRHFGFTQVLTALVADACFFNSAHNRDTFLNGTAEVMRAMPDARPPGLVDALAAKSEIVPFPVVFPVHADESRRDVPAGPGRERGPHVLWNHRWEHDKDPETFFDVLERLAAEGLPFRLLVCGERFGEVPPVFARARGTLSDRIEHWGPADGREPYRDLLQRAQIVVSTARHEFFGVAMLEAADGGAFPLVPDRLAYPELFPIESRYRDEEDLAGRLRERCLSWAAGRCDLRADRGSLTRRFAAERVVPMLVGRLARLRRLPAGPG